MRSRSKELLDRAISAMLAAIETYNKPTFPYRVETFSILAINAWELLLKSKWLADHKNKSSSLYVYEVRDKKDGGKSLKKYIKTTRSGNPFTHSMDYIARKLIDNKSLDQEAWDNLQIVLELRDCSIHFYSHSPAMRVRLQEVGAACAKNFATAIRIWFSRDLTEFELHLMPLALIDLPTSVEGMIFNAEEKNFIKFLEQIDSRPLDPNAPYSITVNIDVKFTRSKSKDALATTITNDPNAAAIRMTEENVREKYPWDYTRLTDECKKKIPNFKIDKKYHKTRLGIASDPKFGTIRFLDPNNAKGQKKPYFNPNILAMIEKHYKLSESGVKK